jgi:copper homeostasis protein
MSYQNDMIIEICTDDLATALAAQKAGASRLELCASLVEGGITPSFSLMQQVCKAVTIPVHVMIRPRGGDFLYSDEDFELMKADISHARKAGAAGVVFGILRNDGSIDRERCQELFELASPMKVTFHRAFDMSSDPFVALEEIIEIGCNILLTSGHRQTAEDGLELIRELVKRAGNRIEVMAGSGVNESNVMLLHIAGVRAFHFTSRKKVNSSMHYRNEALQSMGNNSEYDEYAVYSFDEEKIKGVFKALTGA